MRQLSRISILVLAFASLSIAQTHQPAAALKKTKPTSKTLYYGAVDLGSKGTKAALFSFVAEEEGRSPDVIFSKTINTKLVSSMKDGQFSKEGIKDAVDAVTQVTEAMKAEATRRNIDVDVYYVVGSSAVAKVPNKDELVAGVKDATGIDMDFIDVSKEGYYTVLSSIPLSRRPNSMLIDIGSGNTKLGCLVGDSDIKNFKSAEVPFGSVSGRNEAAKRNPKDINAGVEAVMADVSDAYEKQSRDIPCLRNRQRVYWSGGAAWATATFTHPEKALNGWVVITKDDLKNFLAQLKDGSWNQKKPIFHFPANKSDDKQQIAAQQAREAAIRQQALKDRDDVQNVFVREDLLSGVSIMNAVLNSSNPSATIRFARSGNFIYGYTLEKFKAGESK
jgi:exopolyphosphatase/pppGpp-phosphohydrolase